ncbi:MAG: sodium:calcium symporter, partial [Bacteroidota bacterium]
LQYGFLEELDYWAGTFGLVIVALVEVIVFAWLFGMDKAWIEINHGADIKVPKFFYYIIKWVTPIYLILILVFWTYQDAIGVLMMEGVAAEDVPYRWAARAFMFLLAVGLLIMIAVAWKRNKPTYEHFINK